MSKKYINIYANQKLIFSESDLLDDEDQLHNLGRMKNKRIINSFVIEYTDY